MEATNPPTDTSIMVDLSTTYLGLKLRTPLVVSASPLSEDLARIRQMEDAGAAAVVLYSLFEEELIREQHELNYHLNQGTESFAEALTYVPEPEAFFTGPELYLEHIANAKRAVDIPIIGSLNGSSMGGWTDFAKQIEEAGADALELNIYNIPTDFDMSGADVETSYLSIVSAVRSAVNIPVAVKLSPFFSNMANMAKRFDEAGADALVLFNRFYQPDIDIDELMVTPKIILSSEHELRLPLRWIAILYNNINADLAATTGVHSARDAIKFLMAGANVTMMASALFKNGIGHISIIEEALQNWMEENEYPSVELMRGSMSHANSGKAGAIERAQYVKAVSSLPDDYPLK